MSDRLFDLAGKVALVTGATRGIGFGIAAEFARRGAKVGICSRKADACERARAAIASEGGDVLAVACNVADRDALEAFVGATRERFGRIDVLVCNAAANPYFGPLAGLPDAAYDRIMETNVRSNVRLCNLVIPEMAARKDGAVIILSSIAGLKGTRMLGAYALSKAADAQLARNLAVEWGGGNVRVNCLAPGIVKTDFAKALYDDPATYATALKQYPLGRLGDVDDIVGAAVFLASRAGAFVTGQTIVIDGGTTIGGFD